MKHKVALSVSILGMAFPLVVSGATFVEQVCSILTHHPQVTLSGDQSRQNRASSRNDTWINGHYWQL